MFTKVADFVFTTFLMATTLSQNTENAVEFPEWIPLLLVVFIVIVMIIIYRYILNKLE